MEMRMFAPLLVAAVWVSPFVNARPAGASGQASRKASEAARQLYDMAGRGDIEGIETLILFPRGATNLDITMFKMSLEGITQDLKRCGGIRSFTVLSEDVAGGQSEVVFEYVLGDGTTAKTKLSFVYDADKWKIPIDPAQSISLPQEIGAIILVREIANAQIIYSVTKGAGKFTDLATLGRERLIDPGLATGEKQGYLFSSKALLGNNRQAMFDTTARPKHPDFLGMWNRSFYCNESAVVYEARGGKPPTATVSNRVPADGSAIDR